MPVPRGAGGTQGEFIGLCTSVAQIKRVDEDQVPLLDGDSLGRGNTTLLHHIHTQSSILYTHRLIITLTQDQINRGKQM